MSNALDLVIKLSPPPAGSDALATISLDCPALGMSDEGGDLLHAPLNATDKQELLWYLETYWRWPYDEFVTRAKAVEQHLLPKIGKTLYAAVFGKAETAAIMTRWNTEAAPSKQISILSSVPAALSLPWELLHDEQGFLVLRGRQPVTLVRRVKQSQLGGITEFEPPLRILLVTARPIDAGFVDPRGIARELLEAVEPKIEAGSIAVEFLRPPTLAQLNKRLSQQPPIHILHFDGHGTFEEKLAASNDPLLEGGARGKLAFEDDEGTCDLVDADNLAQVLQASGVRLALLTACQSAVGSADDAFSSVATRLIKGGIDSVAAMGASVLVATAARYVDAFYTELAEGTDAALAQERARQALHANPRRHPH